MGISEFILEISIFSEEYNYYMMDVLKELNLHDPLKYFLQTTCTDLNCYGESYCYNDDAFEFQQSCCDPGMEITSDLDKIIKDFSATADSEKYILDVGLPGMGASVHSYQIFDLKLIVQDHYFINQGGKRLAESAEIFTTAVTIPLRAIPWNHDLERIHWNMLSAGSCLPYRQNPLVGVIVLYFQRPPKLMIELKQYLDTVLRCTAPVMDLMTARRRYVRLVSKGGNRYRRLRRALLSTIRAKKLSTSVPADGSAVQEGRVVVIVPGEEGEVGEEAKTERDLESGLSKPAAVARLGYQSLSVGSTATAPMSETAHTIARGKPELTQSELILRAYWVWGKGYLHKWWGGEPNMPPRVDIRLSYATLIGCFVTIAVWRKISDAINRNFVYDGVVDPMTLPGSFGALCTLVFALPTTPLSQPRIFFLAHTWALAVSTVLMLIWKPYHFVWLQEALSVGIAVAGMAKFGILNPPAGAVALSMMEYANSPQFSYSGWLFLIVSTYLGCAMCMVVGLLWHNCYTGRVYPVFW